MKIKWNGNENKMKTEWKWSEIKKKIKTKWVWNINRNYITWKSNKKLDKNVNKTKMEWR